MIYHFILNPRSGRKRKYQHLEDAIKIECKKRALSYHIYYTTCPGDATEYVASMVRISQDKQRFICIGGDGTINEVVNSAPCNENVEFGVIPSGSGNDFIKNFTNTETFANIEAQLDGEVMSFDAIKCNDTYCINMINIGFDCAVAKLASKLRNFWFIPVKSSYLVALFITAFKKIGTKMKLIFDDGTVIDKTLTLTAIGNGRYCGGGFCSNPNALLSDGIMDICAIDKVSIFKFVSLVGAYKKGKHFDNERAKKVMSLRREKHFKMEFYEPVPVCIDGEIKGAKNIDFTVVPNGFKFVIPKGSEYKYRF